MTTALEIIDQQEDFIVVNKPAGVNFHDEGEQGKGFFNQVKRTVATENLYPVHRLDKMTSGLLIFAKNLHCARKFQQLFEQHKVDKYYLALSDKKPKKKQGLVKGDMAKSRRSAWKLLRTQANPAISQFFSFSLPRENVSKQSNLRLYLVKPHTGKTHQIRVALNSIGAPIIGDDIYHPSSVSDRGYLHAYTLRFELNNQVYSYTALPSSGEHFTQDNILTFIKDLGEPAHLHWPQIKKPA